MAQAKPCCEILPVTENSQVGASTLRRHILLSVIALAAWYLIYRQLSAVSEWLAFSLLGLNKSNHFGSAVQFLLFEVPKVLMLLVLVVFGVGVVRSFFTLQRTRAMLAGKRESAGNLFAALLGVVTPFCSCSAVPLFIGFVTAGVPLGVTFSISSCSEESC